MKYPVITPEERRQRLEPPRKKIHVVIDSDTYNEVDDQFAISYAMLSPEKIQMEAIYAAPFSSDFFARLMQTDGVAIPMTGNLKEGLELSYQEILKLLGLLGREDFKDRVFRGSERYMTCLLYTSLDGAFSIYCRSFWNSCYFSAPGIVYEL